MLDIAKSLPEDPAELRAFTALLLAGVTSQAVLIQKLQHQLAGHPAHRFGASSETSDQLQLALKMSEMAIAALTAKLGLPEDAPVDKPKRKPIPDHIPRIEVKLTPGTADCAQCGGKLRRLGEDVTEELEYVPGPSPLGLNQWRTMARHREPHRAAPDGLFRLRLLHPSPAAVTADRARASPFSANAGIRLSGNGIRACRRMCPLSAMQASPAGQRVNKYADHLPLHRQSQIFDREGLDPGRSTLADWSGQIHRFAGAAGGGHPLPGSACLHAREGDGMCRRGKPSSPMTPRSQCWPPALERAGRHGCGLTGAMNATD